MKNTIKSIKKLRDAFQSKNLTLYLGAGVSMGCNVPSWEKLVLSMYFNKISQEKMVGWRPYSNYLYAIAEWYLSNSSEPLEITARKLRKYYYTDNGDSFLEDLYFTLYGSFYEDGGPSHRVGKYLVRDSNPTLDAIAELCNDQRKGVRAVITYNYDNLLEIALEDNDLQSVHSSSKLKPNKLPIYHVHGFVPFDKSIEGSKAEEIVFTEDQYHQVAENPYNWSNLVQLQLMANSIGLMIGLSLSDRNMRRLLDGVRKSPINSENYVLLKEPDTNPPDDHELDKIHQKAIDYLHKFERSGIKSKQYRSNSIFTKPGEKANYQRNIAGKKELQYQYEIAEIIREVKRFDKDQQEYVLNELGVIPIWFREFSDISDILGKIRN